MTQPTEYYCHSCDQEPLYLDAITDTESPYFDSPCCPYCGSTSVEVYGEETEVIEEASTKLLEYQPEGNIDDIPF